MKALDFTAGEIIRDLEKSFSDVGWQSGELAEPVITTTDAEETLKHIFIFTDDVKKFYLPRILRLVLEDELDDSRRSEWIRLLVSFLDADFEERTPGADALLKQSRMISFASYTQAQSRAIWQWLQFVRKRYNSVILEEELTSALRYWRKQSVGWGGSRGSCL